MAGFLSSVFFSTPKPQTTLEKLEKMANKAAEGLLNKVETLLGDKDPEVVQFAHKVIVGLAALSMALDKSDSFNRCIIQQFSVVSALILSLRALIKVSTSEERKEVLKATAIAFAAGYATSIASDYGMFS